MNYTIEQILPHSGRAILVNEVISYNETFAVVAINISADTAFFQDGKGVPAHVGLEYMAQACGTYAGIMSLNKGEPVKLGFLLGTRDYKCNKAWYVLAERLIVSAEQLFQTEDGMGSFFCKITCNDIELASAHLNVFQPNDVTNFLEMGNK